MKLKRQLKIKNFNVQCSMFSLQKGISIYLAFMVMTILLAIALGISVILISQIRMIKGMEDSIIALHAADTGIGRILYEDKICRQAGCPSPPCYPPEATCASPCRPDCWGLLEGAQFSGSFNKADYLVTHTYCPDFNGNGIVDYCGDCVLCPGDDICIIEEHFGETPANPGWDPKFDLITDATIDISDLVSVAKRLGTNCQGYDNFKSSGEVRETKRAIEVTR